MSTHDEHETDPEQERVRRLLADLAAEDAASPPPMPADAAGDLDDLVARLSAERQEQSAPPAPARETSLAEVVPLRRRLAPLLVAAAAVVLVAGGAVAVVQGDLGTSGGDAGGGGSSAAGSTTADEDAPASEDGSAGDEQESAEAPQDLSQEDSSSSAGTTRMTEAPYLSRGTFEVDATTLLRRGEVAAGGTAGRARVEGSGCFVPDQDLGASTFVSLDGEPAVLVVEPPEDGEARVVALACADGSVAAETQVPAEVTE